MNDVVLVRSCVVTVGGVKLERFPLSLLFDFLRPLGGELDVELVLHPVEYGRFLPVGRSIVI